jgi:hypothetical protein
MNHLHPPKTALESRFEEELAARPGWRPWVERSPRPSARRSPARRTESPRDRMLASAMILGR